MQGDSIKANTFPFGHYEMGQAAVDCKRELVSERCSAYPGPIDRQDH